MKEKEELIAAVRRVAWGCVLLHLNFTLGTLNILPNWLGYALILSALPTLGQGEPSALLLRPLGQALAIWEGILWLTALFGLTPNIPIVTAIATVVVLYFHFQLLTNIAAIAQQWHCPQQGRILTLRTIRTLLITVLALPIGWTQTEAMAIITAIAHIAVAILICSALFSFCDSLRDLQLDDARQ